MRENIKNHFEKSQAFRNETGNIVETLEYDQEKLLKIEEICQIFNLQESYFYAPCRRKGPNAIPCIKIGKYLRYHLPTVSDHFAKQNQKNVVA